MYKTEAKITKTFLAQNYEFDPDIVFLTYFDFCDHP